MFEPRAEIEDSRRSDDGNLVPAMIGGDAQDGSQDDPWIEIGGRGRTTRGDHFLRVFQEFLNVQAHDRGGNHAEVGNRGIAATDAWHTHEDPAELISFGDLLHLGARIRDSDEVIAGFFLAHFGLYTLEEVLFVDVGLERASRLARNDAEDPLEIDFRFDGLDLRRVGGIENMQLGKSFHLSKRHAQNFRAQAGAAHAQQERIFESRLLHVPGDLLQNFNVRHLLFGDGQPAEPVTLVRTTPERSILLPETRDFIILLPVFERPSNRPGKPTGQLVGQPV